ncbi:hypothetical protein [Desulfogranum marinum]|uniref:hypothetical protein n=1 Tax=Desulfogranum marinum TaxID=453220 RepID=UPI001964B261|nr:hypothetical protein [Desulfogranum marinum]MBM9514731.1 hypothetical protein [Desulfogranum marinum]
MLPPPTNYYLCSSCHKVYRDNNLRVNDIYSSSSFWSDGLEVLEGYDAGTGNKGWLLQEYWRKLIKCPSCHSLQWLDEITPTMTYDWFSETAPNVPDRTPSLQLPSVTDLTNALDNQSYQDLFKEKYLRLNLWWQLNDIARDGKKRTQEQEDTLQQNLIELLGQLTEDSGDDSERLKILFIKSEANRELQRFRESKRLLEQAHLLLRERSDNKLNQDEIMLKHRLMFTIDMYVSSEKSIASQIISASGYFSTIINTLKAQVSLGKLKGSDIPLSSYELSLFFLDNFIFNQKEEGSTPLYTNSPMKL